MNAAGADEVILALEQAGVLREVDDEEEYPGPGRPARRWQVNPALLAKPAAQIAESPSLASAAGEVSSSYDDGGVESLGSRPPAKSLAQIAEKQTAADSKEEDKEGEAAPRPTHHLALYSRAGGLAKMIKRLAGARTSRSATPSVRSCHCWERATPVALMGRKIEENAPWSSVLPARSHHDPIALV